MREFDATSPALAKLVDTAWSWFCDGANTRSPRRIPRGIAVPHSGPEGLAHTIEVYESGAIRVATDHVVWRSDTTEPTFNPREAMSMAVQALALAAAIADLAGTRGSFGLGVLLGDMSGAYADPLDGWSASQGRIRDMRTPYRDTEYRQTTIATASTSART